MDLVYVSDWSVLEPAVECTMMLMGMHADADGNGVVPLRVHHS